MSSFNGSEKPKVGPCPIFQGGLGVLSGDTNLLRSFPNSFFKELKVLQGGFLAARGSIGFFHELGSGKSGESGVFEYPVLDGAFVRWGGGVGVVPSRECHRPVTGEVRGPL